MKPNNDMLKSIEAITQLLSPTSDKRKVDIIAIKAKVIRNFFLDSFLSAKSPRIGANRIRNKLADEFAIPRVNVRSASDKDDANSSAYIIG